MDSSYMIIKKNCSLSVHGQYPYYRWKHFGSTSYAGNYWCMSLFTSRARFCENEITLSNQSYCCGSLLLRVIAITQQSLTRILNYLFASTTNYIVLWIYAEIGNTHIVIS